MSVVRIDDAAKFFQCDCEGECKGHEMTDEENEEFKRIVKEVFEEEDGKTEG